MLAFFYDFPWSTLVIWSLAVQSLSCNCFSKKHNASEKHRFLHNFFSCEKNYCPLYLYRALLALLEIDLANLFLEIPYFWIGNNHPIPILHWKKIFWAKIERAKEKKRNTHHICSNVCESRNFLPRGDSWSSRKIFCTQYFVLEGELSQSTAYFKYDFITFSIGNRPSLRNIEQFHSAARASITLLQPVSFLNLQKQIK